MSSKYVAVQRERAAGRLSRHAGPAPRGPRHVCKYDCPHRPTQITECFPLSCKAPRSHAVIILIANRKDEVSVEGGHPRCEGSAQGWQTAPQTDEGRCFGPPPAARRLIAGVGKLTGWVMGLMEADQGAGREAEAGACFLPLIADPPRKHLSEQPAATARPLRASEPRVCADVHVVLRPLECQIRLSQRQTPFWL